jgi:hypothetical protein
MQANDAFIIGGPRNRKMLCLCFLQQDGEAEEGIYQKSKLKTHHRPLISHSAF